MTRSPRTEARRESDLETTGSRSREMSVVAPCDTRVSTEVGSCERTPRVTAVPVARRARGPATRAALGLRRASVSRLWLMATALILCCCGRGYVPSSSPKRGVTNRQRLPSEAQIDYAVANSAPLPGDVFPLTPPLAAGAGSGAFLPVPPSRRFRIGRRVLVRGHVHVVHVVGRRRPVVAVVPPALGGPHRRPDPVPPDDVVEVELGGVRLEEGRDLVAERLVAGHDVDRLARGVLTVRVVAEVGLDLRKGVANRAVDQDGRGGEPVLDGAVEGVCEGVGEGVSEGEAAGVLVGFGGLGGRGWSAERYAAVTQRASPSMTSSARSPDRRPVVRTFWPSSTSPTWFAPVSGPVHRLSGAVVHRCSWALRIACWVCRASSALRSCSR